MTDKERCASRNEILEAARQALTVAADKLLQAAEMEERNHAIAHGKRGKAWDGAFVRREKLAAMEAVRTALADNIGHGSIEAVPSERREPTISAGGAHDWKLFGTPGVTGTVAGLTIHIDPSVPDNTVIVRDDLGRELGRIINVGK